MPPAKPEISHGRKFTAVWIIPLVAVALGIWMVVHAYLNEGPDITIQFKTAEGLEAGKTKVKYRNIDMGVVQKVSLSDDLEFVNVEVQMEKNAEPLLREDSRFWVVRARVGGGGVTGLETLLSGAYIGISPGVSSDRATEFTGLELPPPTPADAPGLRLILIGEDRASLDAGDWVVYKGFNVGRIESAEFDPENGTVRHSIFIDAPYDELVNSATRFWNIGGISLSTDGGSIQVATGSLETILHGGVTFGLPEGRQVGQAVDPDTRFRLYDSYNDVLQEPFEQRIYYVVEFSQSLRGLEAGAPVEYRGIKLGAVERLLANEVIAKNIRQQGTSGGAPLPVLIYIEPAQLNVPDTAEWSQSTLGTVEAAVASGLRASLQTGNLLTGAKYVNLDFYSEEPERTLGVFEGYPVIPSIGSGLDQIEHKVITLLDKLNQLPVEGTMTEVNQTLDELDRTLVALRTLLENESTLALPGELEASVEALRGLLEDDRIDGLFSEVQASLDSLQTALESANLQLQGDSAEVYQLNKTLKEVELAARSLREFFNLLEARPEALISGKKKVDP